MGRKHKIPKKLVVPAKLMVEEPPKLYHTRRNLKLNIFNRFSRLRSNSLLFWSGWRYPEQSPQRISFHSNKWQKILAHYINFSLPNSTYQRRYTPWQRRQKRVLMTHKNRGSIVVLSISKSVEPNEEQKEMISGFQQGILCKYWNKW